MVKKINIEELKSKIDNKEDFYLIDALSENSFSARHIPGAKNVPNGPDYAERFESVVGAPKDAEIITYCSSPTCMASVQAADALEKAGYTNVGHYVGGLAEWQDADYGFENAG